MNSTHHPSYLQLEAPLAIYLRGTRTQEVEQKEILYAFALKQGWSDEQISIYSGGTQRENSDWHKLANDMRDERVKTILITDEGSNWATHFEMELLIRLCREHQILILTPKLIYDCRNEVDVSLLLRKYTSNRAQHTNEQEAG